MFSYSRFIHEYNKSYFKFREPISEDYKVTVNGEEVPVYTCRISKYPFNRVWTGFQRPVNQSELASFVNLVSDEPLHIEVKAKRAHSRVLLKPYSKGIVPVETDGVIRFTLPENGQFVLETDSYHHCLYIFNSKLIPAPESASVTHFFGPGIHMPGKITLHSGDSVYVDKDAMVYGCIFAEDAENIRIFGNGVLDDTGEGRLDINCYEPYTNGNLKFYDCKNLQIEGVLCRNSAIWCVNLFHCFDVEIDNIKVFGQWRYNTDGVDIVNSQNIAIRNSFIHSFDDTITVKGIDRYADTDNMHILTENCVLWCDWGRTCEIGIETQCREYRDIAFVNCDILRAGAVALDIQNGDCAEVSDIRFENIRVEYNAFDTREVYQATDEMEYGAENTQAIPRLFSVSNRRFRNPNNFAVWGVPETATYTPNLSGIESGGVHDVICRNIRVYYDEGLPLTDGKYNIPISVHSVLDGVKYRNIRISDIAANGTAITSENAVLDVDADTDFAPETGDDYSELRKNTVSVENQLQVAESVFYENAEGKGPRVMFLGNSITLHGIKPEIGWNHLWGMAASAREKDYVHLLESRIGEQYPDAAYCICQAADWERRYRNGAETYAQYAKARAFNADVIIMRLIENCPSENFDAEAFKQSLAGLLDYLNPTGKAEVILTAGFWKHPGNAAIAEYASERGTPFAVLDDLGSDDAMKAVGLFWHTGVASHPGDLGMQNIADRIWKKLEPMLAAK